MAGKRMRTDWRSIRVHPHASMLQTMAVVSDGRLGIVLVVDEDDRLQGTVTDGDMRRAILRQVGLDAPVSSVMERRFTAVTPDVEPQAVLMMMHTRSIKQVPVCDAEGRVVGLYVMEDFIEPTTRPNWAIIMAGGKGRRLWPLTAYVPKPMLPVGNRPILEVIVAQLVSHGFRRIFISINYMGDQIVKHFDDGRRFGCSIEYLREDEPLGTGGALSLLPERPEHPLLVTNGDLLTNIDLSELMDYHQAHGAVATLCAREFTYEVPYGVVRCEDDRVLALEEKPVYRQLINAGIYVLDPCLLDYVPTGQFYPLTNLIEEACARGLDVKAFFIQEEWMDIGHLEDYEQARSGGLGEAEHG